MKFQKLTIHNIASIEDAVIDFEAQPLSNSEVFLITGKTGAGKSTILDAICLALYADTPRLDNTKMQGETNDAGRDVKINDPRQLMRRNTGEAFAMLTFIGNNGVHYEATWSVARARKKVTGKLQDKEWHLRNIDADYTLVKKVEIEAEIKMAVGLDFSQFCRTTMLAQGEFTRFLNSKDDEKAEILEKITGVDIYSRIGAKIFEVTSQKKQDWEQSQQRVEGIRVLAESEIAERQEALNALETETKHINSLKEKETAKLEWIKADNEFNKAVSDAKIALERAVDTIEKEEFKQQDALVRDWNETIDARGWLTEIIRSSEITAQQSKLLEELKGRYVEVLNGQRCEELKKNGIEEELKAIESYLEFEKVRIPAYENSQKILGLLRVVIDGRGAIAKCEKSIEKEKKTLSGKLIPDLDKAKSEVNKAKALLEQQEEEYKNLEETVANLRLPELREQHQGLINLLSKIERAKDRIATLAKEKTRMDGISENLIQCSAGLEKKKEEAASMELRVHDAELELKIRKEAFDKQSDTVNKFASTLRQKLHVGDICPVCRQRIDKELPHEGELYALVSDLRDAFEKAQKEYDGLKDKYVKLNAEIKTESKSYERDKVAFEKDKSIANAEKDAVCACEACGIKSLSDSTLLQLHELQEKTETSKRELEVRIGDGEAKEKENKKIREALYEKRKELEKLNTKVTGEEKKINDCNGRIVTSETLAQAKNKEIILAQEQASELLEAGDWKIDWIEKPEAFSVSLQNAAESYGKYVSKRQQFLTQYESIKANIANIATVIRNILQTIPVWAEIQPEAEKEVKNLFEKANEINASVSTAISQLKMAEEANAKNQSLLDSFLLENEKIDKDRLSALNGYTNNDIMQMQALLKAGNDAVVAKRTLHEKATQQQLSHQQNKPEMSDEDTFENLLVRIEEQGNLLEEILGKKVRINQELKADKESKAERGALIEEAEKKKEDYEKWSRMNQLIGDANGHKFRKIAQSYVLTSLVHSANNYMKTLTDRYALRVTPGTFVIMIEDAYQGYVSRAASTISGGESFLVSLSLALALSDIGQTLSADILFIDEGFGTLSGEPLQNAVNTLRSLHTKAGRHVGIISHVEELQERIPIQIQLIQEGKNSCSKIRVVPEQ